MTHHCDFCNTDIVPEDIPGGLACPHCGASNMDYQHEFGIDEPWVQSLKEKRMNGVLKGLDEWGHAFRENEGLKKAIVAIADERALAFEMLKELWEHANHRVDWLDGEDGAVWAAERAPAMIKAYKERMLKTLIFEDDEKRQEMWKPPPPEDER